MEFCVSKNNSDSMLLNELINLRMFCVCMHVCVGGMCCLVKKDTNF